jgi:hypothetical protein
MPLRKSLTVALLVLGAAILAASYRTPPAKAMPASPAVQDRQKLNKYLHGLGHVRRGGVARGNSANNKAFPTFTSSFTVNGTTYPFTMIGEDPSSGRSTTIKSLIIPLRMNFVGFGDNGDMNITFDPRPAVNNMVASPLYQSATFPNGEGQFCDQMQRAAFWNRMDSKHKWHIYMAKPDVAPIVDINVYPNFGQLFQFGQAVLGNVPIDLMDYTAQTLIGQLGLRPDVLPIFVTDGVTADALGFHSAYEVPGTDPTQVQTYIFTSWLDPTVVPPIYADVSTFNHELAEWMNDPFVNNIVPEWAYPPASDPRTVCADNPYLEVGDPQGNGPTYDDFPTAEITLKGVTYHLQQLVLWQWFADEVPSSAYGGWYTFPIPSSLNQPAVYCP